jgi:excinuclease ABC subunit A
LHFEDVRKLLEVLHRLVEQGNTVVVIEHNLDVIKTADWVLDLGPGGGVNGGKIVVEGTPEQVAAEPKSFTGQYLKPLLARAKSAPAEAGAQSINDSRAQPKKTRRKTSSSEDQPDLIPAK